jgi:hypothetical protein
MFDIEKLNEELKKYADVLACNFQDEFLELAFKNKTGKAVTYERIRNDMILPYFDLVNESQSVAPKPVCLKQSYKKK